MGKHVYFFGGGEAEGRASMRELLGGKGANLAEMTALGVPVPPGFTITTQACIAYYDADKKWPPGLHTAVADNLARLESMMGAGFGTATEPLLLSVRSGARVSMPGMMDTVLNLGLNDDVVQGLRAKTGNARFAYDSYRRLLQMYGDVVLGVPRARFDEGEAQWRAETGHDADDDLGPAAMEQLIDRFKALIATDAGAPFPQDVREQLEGAISAVFDSWHTDRAARYRRLHRLPDDWGTAVTVQAMVFGNMGPDSGTGVVFTRNPSTGARRFYGEFLAEAQGEDVVAGIRTAEPVRKLNEMLPAVYEQLKSVCRKLEAHYRDVQDVEFTVQAGKLYVLQTRRAQRTAAAAVRTAVDMVTEGVIDEETALKRVHPGQLEQLLHEHVDPDADGDEIARGLPASPGGAVGRIVFTAAAAERWAAEGEPVILVRRETSPEDIGGMDAAVGILTSTGGMTSHAAVVARGMGKCCVAGAGAVHVDEANRHFTVGERTFGEGDWVTLNGGTGQVFADRLPLIEPEPSPYFMRFMAWADGARTLGVRANADTPNDALLAREFGAEGIGLCRTEHMFFGGQRIQAVREMVLARDEGARRRALEKLLPLQRDDFYGILHAMDGCPVTIRLLDPPLHEFLPKDDATVARLAAQIGVPVDEVHDKIAALHEFNPMLGHRGCRLAITFPEIYEMQARAIFEAAAKLVAEGGRPRPEVMIPLIGTVEELTVLKGKVEAVAADVEGETGVSVPVVVGTMIEVPRAVLVADDIAREAAFFSFGTNDLTQMAFGFSRDDAGAFLPAYVEQGVLAQDPFQTLDVSGVGQLLEIGVRRGRAARPDLVIGICGEHGGDPDSIAFCHRVGMDYVSCSPYRVPVARLAAAQAGLRWPRG